MEDEQLARNIFNAFIRFKDAVVMARDEGMEVHFGVHGGSSIGRDPTQKRPIVSRTYKIPKKENDV